MNIPRGSCLPFLIYSVFSMLGLLFLKLVAWFPPSLPSDILNVTLLESTTYNGDCHLHYSHFLFLAFQGFPKTSQNKHQQLFVYRLSLGQLQCKHHEDRKLVLYSAGPFILEQCLTQSRCSINIGYWRVVNMWSPIICATAHLLPLKIGFVCTKPKEPTFWRNSETWDSSCSTFAEGKKRSYSMNLS